jgi:hypothetical protein
LRLRQLDLVVVVRLFERLVWRLLLIVSVHLAIAGQFDTVGFAGRCRFRLMRPAVLMILEVIRVSRYVLE